MRHIRLVLAAVGVLFGLVTLVEGSRVLAGVDPGYIVFKPLLVYNVAMGVVYVAAGLLAWRWLPRGRALAGVIVALNLVVFVAVAWMYSSGRAVAARSVQAMTMRTVVWLVIFLGLRWVERRAPQA